jgi:hypothetical protein
MDVTYTHCAGLDIHKKSVVACCLTPGPKGELVSETRTFGTMTEDLLALSSGCYVPIVMTTFPRACPASRYRIASGTSRNG